MTDTWVTSRGLPVIRDDSGAWILRNHDQVAAAAFDPETFSSRVSRHLNIPNGMDGAEHARFRALVERYMNVPELARLAVPVRKMATALVEELPPESPLDAVNDLGSVFAVRAQSIWLGWPARVEEPLLEWMEENRVAKRSGDPERSAAVAEGFDRIIRGLIEERQHGPSPDDLTTRLMNERVGRQRLETAEIVSILRNWVAGDLGTIAACIGVVVHRLATDRELQDRWRRGLPAEQADREIDELLRIDDPFTASRRITTCPVRTGGVEIPAGARVHLSWADANRDPDRFDDPDRFRPEENAAGNLVYGAGPHVCPGRGLATLEIRIAVEELLAGTSGLALDPESAPVRALPPQGGFSSVPVRLAPRT